ncbi:MAG TPA: hypothetical protein DIC58_06805 [Gammaproteobacteria bacterium]|nr:hypothetical protein [Gammaproteobacteria bacterium]
MVDAANKIPLGARQLVATKTTARRISHLNAASRQDVCAFCRDIQQEKLPVIGSWIPTFPMFNHDFVRNQSQ